MNKFAFVTFLTFVRAPLVFAGTLCVLANLARPSPALLGAGVALMALSAVTDLFDGLLARKWGVTSRFGALADPLMDKLFYVCATPAATFVALYLEDVRHASVLLALDVVSLVRDQWASFLRSVGSEFAADVRASWSGKLRTFLAFPILLAVHLHLGVEVLARAEGPWADRSFLPVDAAIALEVLLFALVVFSGIDYTRRFFPYVEKAAAKREGAAAGAFVGKTARTGLWSETDVCGRTVRRTGPPSPA